MAKSTKQTAGDSGLSDIRVIPLISSTELKFTVKNERGKTSRYPPCFANSLRRTILADLPCYLVSRKQIHFTEATSMIHRDMLTHRLHICPIRIDRIIGLEQPASIEFVCDQINTNNEIQNVLLRDFIPKYFEQEITPTDFWTNPDILIAKLRAGQTIRCQGSFHLGTSYTEDSGFQSVAAIRYINGTSDDVLLRNYNIAKSKGVILLEQDELWKLTHREQAVDENNDGCPISYEFTMDNIGVYNPLDIVPVASYILENRFLNISQALDDWINHFPNLDDRKSWKHGNRLEVTWYEADDVPALDLRFSHENETFADLITYWMCHDPRIKFVGFRIPHPSDKLVVIRVCMNDLTIRTTEVAHTIIRVVKEYADKIAKQWAEFGVEFMKQTNHELSKEMKTWIHECSPKIFSL